MRPTDTGAILPPPTDSQGFQRRQFRTIRIARKGIAIEVPVLTIGTRRSNTLDSLFDAAGRKPEGREVWS